MFNFNRRTSTRASLPTWFSHPGFVFRIRHALLSKYNPLVDEVELINANPSYAHIRRKNGSQSTVSLRDLAPITDSNNEALQEHLFEINIRHNDIQKVDSQKNNNEVVLNEDIALDNL